MDYRLYEKKNPAQTIAHADLGDDFVAEKWARQWAQENGSSDEYLIKRADGGLSAQLFKTTGGQWFIMRR